MFVPMLGYVPGTGFVILIVVLILGGLGYAVYALFFKKEDDL